MSKNKDMLKKKKKKKTTIMVVCQMDTGSTERALNGQGWNNLSNKVNSNISYNPKFKKKKIHELLLI